MRYETTSNGGIRHASSKGALFVLLSVVFVFCLCVFVRGAVEIHMVEIIYYNVKTLTGTQAEGKIEQRKHYLGIEDVETHITQLLRDTKIIGKQSVSVSMFDELSVDEQLSFSPFLVDLRKRARLFQRIHTALMR